MHDIKEKTTGVVEQLNPLKTLLVDGKYTPSSNELIQKIKKLDLKKIFQNSRFIKEDSSNILSISFPDTEHTKLFALTLLARGCEKQLFWNVPSDDFFDNNPLDDFRIDSGQFSISEIKDGDRSKATLRLRYFQDNHNKLTNLIKDVVKECMPHLTEQIKDFSL